LWLKIETYLKETNCPDIVLANVDVDFYRSFMGFLCHAKDGLLNKAVRDGMLSASCLDIRASTAHKSIPM
jgi:hypothetical protein